MSLAQSPPPGPSGVVPLQDVAVDRPEAGAPEALEAGDRIPNNPSARAERWR
jgi:hypothetical protein